MKVAIAALLAALAMMPLLWTATSAPAQTAPSAGTMLTGDLLNPRGITLGPDGMLYVAEAGEGGTDDVVVDGVTFHNGHTGRISMIDPSTGTRTTVAEGLPSNAHEQFGTVGPTDVAFIGDQLYYVQTHGGADWGFPGEPTGIYTVNADGSVTLLADIGAFNVANPVGDVSGGGQVDIEPGGNPYAMIVRNGAFYVSDGNQNQVMKVTDTGTITRVAELSGHPVSTGITFDPAGGPFYVSELGQEPFNPEDGRVVTVDEATGTVQTVASGFSALTDVGFGPGGQLYALQFAEQASGPAPLAPFSAKVLQVNDDGTMTPVVAGFTFSTAMVFDGAKLYLTSNGLSVLGPGEIWVIDDITAVPPLATATATPQATAQPTALPSTGTGGDAASGGNNGAMFLALAVASVAGLALAGAWMAGRRPGR